MSVTLVQRSRIGQGLDRDWSGIGQGLVRGLVRDWPGIGQGIGQGLIRDWPGIGQGLVSLKLMFLIARNYLKIKHF